MRIEVSAEKCNACQLCVKKCPYGAIQIQNKCAHILPACILCGICVEVCPQKALSLVGVKQQSVDLNGDLWVYLEVQNETVTIPSLEIVSKLHLLLQDYPHPKKIIGLMVAKEVQSLTNYSQLSDIGLEGIITIPSLMNAPLENKAVALSAIIQQYKPFSLLFPASDEGRDLAPRLATLLETGLTADCTELSFDPRTHLLIQTRPAFSGDLMASIVCPFHRPMMATVRPHSFPVLVLSESVKPLSITVLEDHALSSGMVMPRILEKEPKHSLFPPIEDKSIVRKY